MEEKKDFWAEEAQKYKMRLKITGLMKVDTEQLRKDKPLKQEPSTWPQQKTNSNTTQEQ